ncbi:MAG: glycoside hydrolase family 20 zincin-like fold domain-containing protein, partial [Anaerolineales bacterium]
MNNFGLIPDPVKVCSKPGHFSLSSTTCIVHDDENHEVAVLLQETLLDAIGIRVPVFRDWTKMENVILLSSRQDENHLGAEAYELEVRPDLIQIRASDRRG